MMAEMQLSSLANSLGGNSVGGDCRFDSVTTDSRAVKSGQLFVALAGERFDGHDFLPQVYEAGAAGALVSSPVSLPLPQLQVADTQRGLGLLGAANRDLFEGMLVAITGSSGKTSAKNMVSAVLAERGQTLATEGNYNNEIGVPLTLLRLSPADEFAVVEMGASRGGDIDWLCQLGRPQVAVLLNAMPAHLEGFGSLDDVAAAKGEIFDGLGTGDTAVINADQRWAAQWRARAGDAAVIDFGLEKAAAVTATQVSLHGLAGSSFVASTPAGDMPVRLHVPGEHNIANALAAIAVGLACGLEPGEISAGLGKVRPVAGRLQVSVSPSGATVVDDCYNANPGSVRAAIDLLVQSGGRTALILGAMRELGQDSKKHHKKVAKYARKAGVDTFWGVGEELQDAVPAFGEAGEYFTDRAAAIAALPGRFGEGDVVLIKGSRGAGMERVLGALTGEGG